MFLRDLSAVRRVGARVTSGANTLLGAALRLDERVVNRVSPPTAGAIDPASVPWSGRFEAHWAEIRTELDALLAAEVRLPTTDELVGVPQGADGQWTTYVLSWYGQWIEANCRRCPTTAALLRTVPSLQIAGFTVLGPHTRLGRHRGPMRSLRYQLGVKVPGPRGSCGFGIGDDVVVWEDGASLAFDDRSEHEAWNVSDEPRYVLFVQTPWPVPGPARALHRLADAAFARAMRQVPARAAALDAALNPAG